MEYNPAMPALSITRLHLRGVRFLPRFARHTGASLRQLREAEGLVEAFLAVSLPLTFWTVSCWRDGESMRAFRSSGAHLKAMPHLLDWCDEASVVTIIDHDGPIPTPVEAAHLMREQGRLSKVRHPSAAHREGLLWPDGRIPRKGASVRPA
jgi:hypothetical protein